MPAEKSAPEANRPFVISRVFDARRDIVWKSWTEADRLKQWWGPKGFIVHTSRVDLRPGGMFHYGMTAPDGSEMWGRFLYREIEATELERKTFEDGHQSMRQGWTGTFEQFSDYLAQAV